MRKERIDIKQVWGKPDKFYEGTRNPLLLFVSYGVDEAETEIGKRQIVVN